MTASCTGVGASNPILRIASCRNGLSFISVNFGIRFPPQLSFILTQAARILPYLVNAESVAMRKTPHMIKGERILKKGVRRMRYQSFYPFSGGGSAPRMPFGPPPQSGMFNGPAAGFGRNPGFGPGGFGRRGFGAGGGPAGGGGSFGMPGGQGGQGGQGMSRLESYMRTADRFLSTAQQLSPLINQLSPMMQNIPALMQIYRGFSGAPSAGGGNSAAANTSQPNSEAASPRSDGNSVPRIFQPPF
ncbi:MAG: VrrA/YqfQ family protein [Bhargavaea sp.]